MRHPEYDAAQIAAGNMVICRFPLWLGDEDASVTWYNQLTANGITPMLVLDRRSFTASEWKNGSYRRRLTYWWNLFPFPAYVCAGNEPDGTGHESSRMTKRRARKLVREAQHTWPDATIIAMGLVGIDFSYIGYVPGTHVRRVVLGFHPYAQDATSVQTLVTEIRKYWKGPLWADEWSIPRGDLHEVAAKHSALLESLWRLGIEGTCVFPWTSAMHDGFDGLVDANGTPNEIYAAVAGAATALAGPPPIDTPPPDDFIERVIAGIQDAVGWPYVFGGRSLPPGFDCAGFVMEAFHRQGANITYVPVWSNPHPPFAQGLGYTNAQRLFNNPELLAVDEPARGDLAFWQHTYQNVDPVTHVMIWLGPDRYLGAQSPTAGEYANNSAWWTSRFAGFRRVTP